MLLPPSGWKVFSRRYQGLRSEIASAALAKHTQKTCFCCVLVEDKCVPVLFLIEHHAMEAYWGSESIAPRIIDLGTRWRWVVSFTPRPFYPQGKSPFYPLDRRLGGPQTRPRCGGEKNSQPLSGLEPPYIQPVAQRYTTELSRLLLYTGSCDIINFDLDSTSGCVICNSSLRLFCVHIGSGDHPISYLRPPDTRMYPKVSGLTAWSEDCEWYSSLPPDAVSSLFYVSV
jgi:hypothetical protein